MIDKVKMWVLIHCYRVMCYWAERIQAAQSFGSSNTGVIRRYHIAESVYTDHYLRATAEERNKLYEYTNRPYAPFKW